MPHDSDPRPAREWPIPPMDHAPGAKPSAFTWDMGWLILQRIGDGETMKAITADPRMPAYATVYRWTHVVPEFGRLVAELRTSMAQRRLAEKEAARANRPARTRPGGRKCEYTPARGAAICEAIREGATSAQWRTAPGTGGVWPASVYRWLARHPDFREAFIAACEARDDAFTTLIEDVLPAQVWTQGIRATDRQMREARGIAGRVEPRLYRGPDISLRKR